MSPKAELDVVVRAGAEDIEKLEQPRSTIEPLANTASLVMGTDVEKPAASIAVVDSGVEVFVVLEGKVQPSAEKARLEKEIAAAQKELAGCEKTLANEGFVAKAAPAVVQKKRDRAAELKEDPGGAVMAGCRLFVSVTGTRFGALLATADSPARTKATLSGLRLVRKLVSEQSPKPLPVRLRGCLRPAC